MNLRRKLASSYGLLIIIILAISAGAAYYFAHLGQAVHTILTNNYTSILAATRMKEALEQQNSSALLSMAGHADKARQHDLTGTKQFSEAFDTAAHNITESGEQQIVEDIRARYAAYHQQLESFLSAAEAASADRASVYFDQLEPASAVLKSRLDDLLQLNERAMLAANERALAQSHRAEVRTEILGGIALLLALLFVWRFTAYIVAPITELTKKAQQIAEGDLDQHIIVDSKDEIGTLAAEFNRMAIRLRELRKSDYWQMLIERKKSDAAIDSLYEPVIVTDARGRVTKINRAAAELFGVLNGDNGLNNLSLTDFSFGGRILSAVKDAVTMQRPVAAEDEAALVPVKFGAEERSFRLRTTPMRDADGRLLGAISVLEDITALREVDRLKTEFISIASSKLHAPLRSLQMALHALIDRYAGDLNEKQMELLYSARRDAEQLEELMTDLLELAEIESGTRLLSLEPLRPVDLAQWAVEHHTPAADSKHIRLQYIASPDLSRAMADRRAVQRIFDNLLSNAIRHTPHRGQITIEVSERGGRTIFSVRDTGEGIPEAYLPTLFSRFVHIKERPGGGTGLGLALVKRLVEAQGGQVGVESRVGEGTIFTFTLPVADASAVR